MVDALRAGDYFVTSGEVLLRNWAIEGAGAKGSMSAEAEWTFPPEFAELVWSDGKKVDRQIIRMTEMAPFSSPQIPHSVRCGGKEMGAFRRLGFGRQWRVHAAGAPALRASCSFSKIVFIVVEMCRHTQAAVTSRHNYALLP